MEHKLLSPRSDIIFKLIFGDQRNTDILVDFLQAVLDLPVAEYERVTIVDPSLKQDLNSSKLGILDVKIHTMTGKVIDVEIQVLSFPQMRERIVFYAAKMITEQIRSGEPYAAIKKVISIVITNYRLIQENEAYHNRYVLYDKDTGSAFADILELNVLELPKLPKEADNTALWDWMLFLKTGREEDLSMLSEKNPQIGKAVGVLMELSADEKTRLLNEAREKALHDEASRMYGARQEGRLEGIQDIARNALKLKMSVEEIARITGLTHAEVALLREKP